MAWVLLKLQLWYTNFDVIEAALLWRPPSFKVSFAKCSATVLASPIGYQVLSVNVCIMFAALLNVNRSFIAVVVCRFGLPTYPNPNLGETSLHRSRPRRATRAKPRIEWNRGTQPRKKTSDVYLGKPLPCYYHFDWIFKFAVKWPSMCEKVAFLFKVQFVWSWMPLKCMELLIEHTEAWISEMQAYY